MFICFVEFRFVDRFGLSFLFKTVESGNWLSCNLNDEES